MTYSQRSVASDEFRFDGLLRTIWRRLSPKPVTASIMCCDDTFSSVRGLRHNVFESMDSFCCHHRAFEVRKRLVSPMAYDRCSN